MKSREGYEQLLCKLKESNENEVSLVDPECRLMKNRSKTNAPADSCSSAHC